ncbi:uncharacterized, partial [Tachysurus ichikawai]
HDRCLPSSNPAHSISLHCYFYCDIILYSHPHLCDSHVHFNPPPTRGRSMGPPPGSDAAPPGEPKTAPYTQFTHTTKRGDGGT